MSEERNRRIAGRQRGLHIKHTRPGVGTAQQVTRGMQKPWPRGKEAEEDWRGQLRNTTEGKEWPEMKTSSSILSSPG